MRDRRFRGLEGQSFPRCCALETAPQIASCASTATEVVALEPDQRHGCRYDGAVESVAANAQL